MDIHATEWFERFLKKFKGGILFVSHDRYFLDRVATRVAELEQGSIYVKSGNYSRFVAHKQQMREYVLSEEKRLRWSIRNASEVVQGLKSRRNKKAADSRQKQVDKLNEELKGTLSEIKNTSTFTGYRPQDQVQERRPYQQEYSLGRKSAQEFGFNLLREPVSIFTGRG